MKKLTSLLLIGCIILSCLCISITATDSGNYGLKFPKIGPTLSMMIN